MQQSIHKASYPSCMGHKAMEYLLKCCPLKDELLVNATWLDLKKRTKKLWNALFWSIMICFQEWAWSIKWAIFELSVQFQLPLWLKSGILLVDTCWPISNLYFVELLAWSLSSLDILHCSVINTELPVVKQRNFLRSSLFMLPTNCWRN